MKDERREEEGEARVEDADEQLADENGERAEAGGLRGGGRGRGGGEDGVERGVRDVGVVEEGVVFEEGGAGFVAGRGCVGVGEEADEAGDIA